MFISVDLMTKQVSNYSMSSAPILSLVDIVAL